MERGHYYTVLIKVEIGLMQNFGKEYIRIYLLHSNLTEGHMKVAYCSTCYKSKKLDYNSTIQQQNACILVHLQNKILIYNKNE